LIWFRCGRIGWAVKPSVCSINSYAPKCASSNLDGKLSYQVFIHLLRKKYWLGYMRGLAAAQPTFIELGNQ